MAAYSVLISLFFFEIAVGELILSPKKPCIPTATIQGPCHVCVCKTDGIYHCLWEEFCQEIEVPDPSILTCQPNQLYREATQFCSCTASGHWQSANCMERFNRLVLNENPIKKKIKTNIVCKPDSLYITDCNVCLCKASGVISFDSCTTRSCPKRFKGEVCNAGDVYRSANEFCTCNRINHYTDHYCLDVFDDVIQIVPAEDLNKIIDVGKNEISIDENRCEDDAIFSKDCNICTCFNNKYTCADTKCPTESAALREQIQKKTLLPELKSDDEKCIPANVTLAQDGNEDLPVVREGDPCTPGLSYKMDCNRCHCNSASKLICTKMACVDWSTILRQRSGKLRQGKKSNNPSKKGSKNDEKVSSGKSSLPQLPEGSCVPGKMYRKKCRRCFCNDKGHASCSAFPNGACLLQNVRSPTDVRSPFKREELKNLQTLSSASDKCEAGKTYKVRCNNCICTEKNDLMCTRALCLSFEDINRITAVESSGKKCSENELTKTMCVECKCSNGKTVCQRILNCVSDTRFRLSKGSNDTLKMQLDPYKDKCVPLSIYTNNCNRCYCQPNGSLRCTQKTCLNYSQTKSLEKQFLNSQKLHGQ